MTLQKARAYAYRLIAMRAYSSALLRQKLLRKGFDETLAEQVIEELTRYGYLNDEEFGNRAIKRLAERGYGPRYIREKCRQQGIEVQAAVSEAVQREQIQKLLGKKPFSREQAIRRLERRGFSLSLIFEEVEKFSSK